MSDQIEEAIVEPEPKRPRQKRKAFHDRYLEIGRAVFRYYQRRAVSAINYATQQGKLTKASEHTCRLCGAPAHCWEHRDYGKPLHVYPCCRKCNLSLPPAEVSTGLIQFNLFFTKLFEYDCSTFQPVILNGDEKFEKFSEKEYFERMTIEYSQDADGWWCWKAFSRRQMVMKGIEKTESAAIAAAKRFEGQSRFGTNINVIQ